jgi:hypothetical protein
MTSVQPQARGAPAACGSQTRSVLDRKPCSPQFTPQPPQFALLWFVSQPLSAVGGAGQPQLLKPRLQVEVQIPAVQATLITFTGLHARPQPPQWEVFWLGFTSQPSMATPLQFLKGFVQLRPQTPLLQVAVLLGPEGQALKQALQCSGLVLVSTHCPPQFTRGGVQLTSHFPAWQTLPAPQELPQLPQFLSSVWVFTQAPLHLVYGVLQSKLHVPPEQTGKPFVGAGSQLAPHPPQFGSCIGSTQKLPHLISGELQVKPQALPEQNAWPPGGAWHFVPQAPQFSGSDLVDTHCPPQFVVPLGQLRVQLPLEQTSLEPQILPQLPQFWLSVCLLTHAPLHSESPVPQLMVQAPPTQAVLPPVGATGQVLPQVPQLSLSLLVLTHAPLHFV